MSYKILVFSDSHGHKNLLSKLPFDSVDCVCFCGDGYNDLTSVQDKPCYKVAGNCDFSGEREIIFEAEGHKILLTHGHDQRVKSGLLNLQLYAEEKGCDITLFGHTHLPSEDNCGAITMLNPGSIMPNYLGRSGYAILEITKNKKLIYFFSI